MSKTTPKNEKQDFFEIKSICKTTHIRSRPVQTPRGPDANVAHEAASALCRLLTLQGSARWTGLPPEPTAHALLGALRRHPQDAYVQGGGCHALHRLCQKFAELHGALQRDPSVYATVRAAAELAPYLEEQSWYTKELCVWLQPPCLVWRGRYRWGVGQDGPVRRAHMVASQFYSSHFFHVCNISSANCTIILL